MQELLERGVRPTTLCKGCRLVRPPHPENVVGARFPNPVKIVDEKLKAHDKRSK